MAKGGGEGGGGGGGRRDVCMCVSVAGPIAGIEFRAANDVFILYRQRHITSHHRSQGEV